jgi:hypothetical protein
MLSAEKLAPDVVMRCLFPAAIGFGEAVEAQARRRLV